MSDWTLAQVSRLLGEPQHRLIHLCEQKAVIPDVEEAQGRGSSRRFSERNLLEFAVAFRLQKLALPVSVAAAVNYTLRQFAAGLAASEPDFDIVRSLRSNRRIELKVVIGDGEKVFFWLGRPGEKGRFFGGIEYSKLAGRRRQKRPSVSKGEANQAVEGKPAVRREAWIEIDISEIANRIPLDE